MKYADVTYNAPGDAPAGMPTTYPLKGFRIIPILIAGATIADVIAAYASLVVRVSRSSNARAISGAAFGVVDDLAVPGPDWIRSPGFSSLTLQDGQVGTTYRVFWAEDCYEVMDPGTSPMLNGFAGAAASIASPQRANIGPAGASTQASASTANKPSSATDGLAVSAGHRGAYATVSTVAGQTISAIGAGASDGLVWWKYNSAVGRWAETLLVEQIQIGARDAAGLEQLLSTCNPGDRIYAEARNITATAGALTVSLSVS